MIYRVYIHFQTLLGEFPTRELAQAEVREYRRQTGNEAYYIEDRQEGPPDIAGMMARIDAASHKKMEWAITDALGYQPARPYVKEEA